MKAREARIISLDDESNSGEILKICKNRKGWRGRVRCKKTKIKLKSEKIKARKQEKISLNNKRNSDKFKDIK